MTKYLSFARVLEEAAAHRTTERASGAVENLDTLLKSETIQKLESYHHGLFAFLAYHPTVHAVFAEYLSSGALASDAGKIVLALFVVSTEARMPKTLDCDGPVPGLKIDAIGDDSYRFVEKIIPLEERRPLPGIVFFDSLLTRRNAVYVPCNDLETPAAVSHRCQEVFLTANRVFTGTELTRSRFDEFCEMLLRQGIQYYRSGNMSFAEWLIRSYRLIRDHGKDLATVVKAAVPLF